jgi:hypothetical protein
VCVPFGNKDDISDSDDKEVNDSDSDHEEVNDATQFNAENHVHFFEQTLHFYKKEYG